MNVSPFSRSVAAAVVLTTGMLIAGCPAPGGGGGKGGGAGGGTGGGTGTDVTISTTKVPGGAVGVAYTTTLLAKGGKSPYTWSVSSGTLPGGITLSSKGALSGKPTAAGSFQFGVTVKDSSSPAKSAKATFNVVVASALAIDTKTPPPNGAVNAKYSASILATGGTQPYTFAVADTATLPTGLTLATDGLLSGTPTKAGSFTFKVTATDAAAQTAEAEFTVAINAEGTLTVTTPSLPPGIVGVKYSASLAVTNGTAPYTWTVDSGMLPNGVTLDADGMISGTPTVAGSSTVTFKIVDNSMPVRTTTAMFTIVIATPLVISTSTVPTGALKSAYSATLTATGGKTPYAWRVASGALPAGVTLDEAAGTLSGTPTESGTFPCVINVSDTGVPTQTTSVALNVLINPELAVQTTSLASAIKDATYSAELKAVGGVPPYQWKVSTGALPAGITLNANGTLSGKATATGEASFTVEVSDASSPAQKASGALKLAVNGAGTLSFAQTPLQTGIVSFNYSADLSVTGGTAPYTFTLTNGMLPDGITFSAAGSFSGMPTATGSSNLTIEVKDSSVPAQTATATFALIVADALSIPATSLPAGVTGTAYATNLTASGGIAPFTWSFSGSLPAGVTLASNGALTGTPTAAGSFAITFRVADSSVPAQSAFAALTLTIVPELKIVTTVLPTGLQDADYSATLSSTGGSGTVKWTKTGGTLPTGLSLSEEGVISGKTSDTGPFTVQVTATDSGAPQQSKVASLSGFINGKNALTVTTTTMQRGTVGQAYNATFTATGGTPPYSWIKTSGAFAPGLTLAADGKLTGTPTQEGSWAFTVQVTDSSSPNTQSASQTLTMDVFLPLVVETSSLPAGVRESLYNQTVTASGGRPPYTWSVSSGTLPHGLQIGANTGVISGTAIFPGSYEFTVEVKDANKTAATKKFTVGIAAKFEILPTGTLPLPQAVVGVDYTTQLTAIGGNGAYHWFVAPGSTLPAGLSLAENGTISGQPTLAGNTTFILRVQDSSTPPVEFPRLFALTVNSALDVATSPAFATASLGVAYSHVLFGTGGVRPYSWSVTGTLPVGLSLNGATGEISGTPTAPGPFNFSVTVKDSSTPKLEFTRQMALVVGAASLAVKTTTLPVVGAGAYNTTIEAVGGTGPYSFKVTSGALPGGLSLSTAGVLSGTATGGLPAIFTVEATDSAGSPAKAIRTFVLSSALSLSNSPIPSGLVQSSYMNRVTASGGRTPFKNTLTSGTLPAGLTLNSFNGWVVGTPTAAQGAQNLTFTVEDSSIPPQTMMVTLPMTVFSLSPVLPKATRGTQYNGTLSATGGAGPYTFQIRAGDVLPSGLVLDTATGKISGTTNAAAGVYIFSVRLRDTNANPLNWTAKYQQMAITVE